MKFKKWLAKRMRYAADRIDHEGAPKLMGWYFTFELGEGIVFNDKGYGCRLMYNGDLEYQKAHDEAVKKGSLGDMDPLEVINLLIKQREMYRGNGNF